MSSMSTQSCKCRLFVAGIPSRVAAPAVETYFSHFGRVRVQTLPPRDSHTTTHTTAGAAETGGGGKSRPLHKGCCILVLDSPHTLHAILAVPVHRFHGRTLQVSEYREGVDLIRHNQQLNRRRVVVKKVPKHWTEETLVSVLSVFGPVQSVYKYKAQCPRSQTVRELRQPTQTFSVVFFQRQAALEATAEPTMAVGETRIVIEKFDRKLNTAEVKVSTQTEPLSPLYRIKGSCRQTTFNTFLNSENTLQENQFSADVKDSLENAPNLHVLKPTKTKYHAIKIFKKQITTSLSTIESASTPNIRFNCVIRSAALDRVSSTVSPTY